MKISARNVLKGKVKAIQHGAVNTEVEIELPGGDVIVSVVTKKAVEALDIQEGSEVYAVIKASTVMLATD